MCVYIHSLLPVAAAIGLCYALSVIASVCLLLGEGPAEFKCSWLIIVVALPIGGAVLYFISYFSRTHRKSRSPVMPQAGCVGMEYFSDGATFLRRLCELISSARDEVLLEFYIIAKGLIWNSVYRELAAALARGVKVSIIYDGIGSALRAPKNDFKLLRRGGAKIKVFNKIMPIPVSRINFRDHRKIAVIDGNAVFLGGVNIADEYANLTSPHGYWKDGGALFHGEIARVFRDVFHCAFNGSCPAGTARERDVRGKFTLMPVADQPENKGSVCEDLIAGAVCSAKKRVYVFTPYLCMGEKLFDALSFAAKRGVDVKILIPHIPDKKLTFVITRTYCERLTAEGVQTYRYVPGFMHFKGVVCDGGAMLGSYNLDYRSMRLNYECGVWGGEELADEMARDFEECIAVSQPYTPPKKRTAGRLAQSLCCLFAPLV
ncbi:MAG: hypothetical protein K2N14_03395 [Clostridia bacterium]|nr:hypothetical protein [Clostridia bacterium]